MWQAMSKAHREAMALQRELADTPPSPDATHQRGFDPLNRGGGGGGSGSQTNMDVGRSGGHEGAAARERAERTGGGGGGGEGGGEWGGGSTSASDDSAAAAADAYDPAAAGMDETDSNLSGPISMFTADFKDLRDGT
jgi:hypothetical protein